MTDLDRARAALPGHTLAPCRDGEIVTSDRRGVMPMLSFLREGRDLSGFCAAALLAAHGIDASCDVRTAAIEDR